MDEEYDKFIHKKNIVLQNFYDIRNKSRKIFINNIEFEELLNKIDKQLKNVRDEKSLENIINLLNSISQKFNSSEDHNLNKIRINVQLKINDKQTTQEKQNEKENKNNNNKIILENNQNRKNELNGEKIIENNQKNLGKKNNKEDQSKKININIKYQIKSNDCDKNQQKKKLNNQNQKFDNEKEESINIIKNEISNIFELKKKNSMNNIDVHNKIEKIKEDLTKFHEEYNEYKKEYSIKDKIYLILKSILSQITLIKTYLNKILYSTDHLTIKEKIEKEFSSLEKNLKEFKEFKIKKK